MSARIDRGMQYTPAFKHVGGYRCPLSRGQRFYAYVLASWILRFEDHRDKIRPTHLRGHGGFGGVGYQGDIIMLDSAKGGSGEMTGCDTERSVRA